MALLRDDTIVAISSAVGPSARMIIRLSGSAAAEQAGHLLECPTEMGAGRAKLHLRDAEVPVIIYRFVAPKSYTGEDLLELHVPGNPPLVTRIVDALIEVGARRADPGEFTARAFFSGRMDFACAEGVAATIAAHSAAELRAARQLMRGELSRRLAPVMNALTDTLALVEAGIDFADEEINFISATDLVSRISEVDARLERIVHDSARFDRLSHEPVIALMGRPNAGKSTLLNALAQQDRAVVSPVAGTTRDVLSAEVRLRRGIVRLLDVAGLDDSIAAPGSIAGQMQRRARQALDEADVVVLVRDILDERAEVDWPVVADLVVLTKRDLAGAVAAARSEDALAVSALAHLNLDELRQRLDALAFGVEGPPLRLALNARHLAALADAREALRQATLAVNRAGGHVQPELIAHDLRESLDALGSILGQISPDDVLGRVFATFCIGK